MDTKPETESLWTVKEAASYLGVAVQTVYQKVHERKIPHLKIGGALRFRKADIDAWLEEHTVQPTASR